MNQSISQSTSNAIFSCTLCSKKIFKSKHGFNIHNTRIHKLQDHSSSNITTNTRVFCTLCTRKSFKSKQGLIRHERYTHGTYNIPRANLISLPEEAINEFKETIVYLIQRQLSNHSSSVGSQCITIPCLESQFIGSIFGDSNWGIRHYTGNQQTAVILFTPTQTEDVYNNTKNSSFDTLPQDQNTAKFEMKVK
ncbi:hypothetical protein F8M41_018433 [Gigaspora margarita]|uniref:C2H2-type domain-containing protein n=1 Tax=Gigaspora margarita TaxID=4874 RepID=A0A8H4ALG5_GIGMA|nr:hypothetical protein F8M41_018433 [Gigaspora margarita]